ncbi:hypothetical protein M441DRAFT_60275 [Trichoderma asperellum CBS 433.97]|uniref:Uncharacterized protein n=1 Tax=Trichoderma asperellum (strain ATCC 204424 / CBS 433.97 / NBRC 101777) TaxID=1042311 RepID=A0A2T3Z2P9_TRIA4|nr:hypothetical protein M441DRAFT_60275 [Trichoderma asperellum CBS 433.97]PTB39084.1 hypothetical protein M441DRAFT_60275 [Trichoderma asperellum CBS 433.97]
MATELWYVASARLNPPPSNAVELRIASLEALGIIATACTCLFPCLVVRSRDFKANLFPI